MKFLIVILMFFILGGLLIVSNSALDFSHENDGEFFYDSYVGWLEEIFGNAKSVTGQVINMDWLP